MYGWKDGQAGRQTGRQIDMWMMDKQVISKAFLFQNKSALLHS